MSVESSSFEDEEIEEDEAFDEEDNARWGDISKKRGRPQEFFQEDEGSDDIYTNLSNLLDNEDDEEEDHGDHSALLKKLESIDRPKKRARGEIAETHQEGETNISGGSKLTISDLLDSVSTNTEFSGLRQHMARLQRRENRNLESKPVHKAQKDRELRVVQFQDTKDLVTEWVPTVLQMQNAAHLSFPLAQEAPQQPSLAILSSASATPSSLEQKIQAILAGTGLDEKKEESDELEVNSISKKEFHRRNKELAHMRSLLFYQEKKLQWHKKIKSKKYRKILRKAKEKHQLTLEEMKELDPDAARAEIEKRDGARALERMTLKHKTTGKWAKQAARHSDNPALKQALNETHQRGAELRKVQTMDTDSEDDPTSDSEGDDPQSDGPEETGVWKMKFMQKAKERQKIEYQELKDQYDAENAERLQKLERMTNKNKPTVAAPGTKEEAAPANPISAAGKRAFGTKKTVTPRVEEPEDDEYDEEEEGYIPNETRGLQQQDITMGEEGEETTPTLKFPSNQQSTQKSKFEVKHMGEPTTKAVSPKSGAGGKVSVGVVGASPDSSEDEEIASDSDDGEVKLNTNIVDDESEEEDNNEQPHNFNLIAKASPQQRELIMRAFANDDVESQFFDEKKTTVEHGLPRDNGPPILPGWGQWSGEGIVETPRGPSRARREALEKKRQDALNKRKDAKLTNVIISETLDKKATKYQVAKLPVGIPNAEVYNATMRNPLGPRWNPVSVHKELVKPRVQTKTGAIIEPIEKKVKQKPVNSLNDAHKQQLRQEKQQRRKSK